MGSKAEKLVTDLEETGRKEKTMDFGTAFSALKQGKKIRRQYWDKDYFLYYVAGSKFQVSRAPLLGIFPEGTEINYQPHIDYCFEKNTCGVWSPTSYDIVAEDWTVLE
jgi:hypothetical protein